jgi:hypothetical protein
MFKFTLNQNDVTVDADKNLLEYLREDARLDFREGWLRRGSLRLLLGAGGWKGVAGLQADYSQSAGQGGNHPRRPIGS